MTEFEYPHTPRRAFINLAEAIRLLGDTAPEKADVLVENGHRVSKAIRELSMPEEDRENVRRVFLSAIRELPMDGGYREGVARAMASVLTGREKFDVERFVHHATSDSDADDDSQQGKWSYNRTHQAEAQKTTIESVPDEGDGETVIM